MIRHLATAATLLAASLTVAASPDTLSLAGTWRFQFDPMNFGTTAGSELYLRTLSDSITLPGSTDLAGKGIINTASHIDRLSRKVEYCGPAWYQREIIIPESWDGRHIELELERAHWSVDIFIDGQLAGADERLSTPDRFDVTHLLTPGRHTLTIRIDNTIRYPMDSWAHGTTEYTQTNWNGVTGALRLISRPKLHIKSLKTYPQPDAKSVKVVTVVSEDSISNGRLALTVTTPDRRTIKSVQSVITPDSPREIVTEIQLGKNIALWDEFNPALYSLSAEILTDSPEETDRKTTRFGMRTVAQGPHHIRLNGHDIHLRGVLDCAVFPLTGFPSTDKADWLRIMHTIRSYGMNHIRFHSWCPPQAAFEAADELGMYLQVELPMWIKDVGQYPARREFFEKEMYAILDEYGNHPSFLLYCNGNENEGDFAVLEDLIKKGQAHDPRHLYSASTARTHVASDQYYASHVTDKGWITVYEGRPSTDWDRSSTSGIEVPVIAHETGQRCMYPDFREMAKYTGVLEPRNFAVFRSSLEENGMLHQAEDFLRATGAHTVLQYKEVNESLLRTPNSGGFQLLGLADFPGQGSAYVGILDAFWESKGLVTPEKFRESCGPVVLLARIPGRIFTPADTLTAKIGVYNFGPDAIKAGNIRWSLSDEDGKEILAAQSPHRKVAEYTVDSLFSISLPLASVDKAGKYTLRTEGAGTSNEWQIWIYPTDNSTPVYTTSWEDAKSRLEKGENVLLIPEKPEGRHTKFASHFWNPIMFNWNPMIVGTLIDASNHAFSSFPTDNYADWQWTDILNNSTAIDLTEARELTPVIQSIDTYEHNRKLGIAFEANVANGRLFVLCTDPVKDIDNRPATRRLISSVASYVASPGFRPSATLTPYMVEKLLFPAKAEKKEASSKAAEHLLNK